MFNPSFDNEIDIRLNKIKANDIYQLNRSTDEYERVSTGSGGGGADFYYLKSNNIKIDDVPSNTFTNVDSNSVDVVNNTNNTSSSLLSNKLILGDINGNSELDKASINTTNMIKNNLLLPIETLANEFQELLYYNTSTNDIKKTNSIKLKSPAYPAYTNKITFSDIILDAVALGSTNIGYYGLNIYSSPNNQRTSIFNSFLNIYEITSKLATILNKESLNIGSYVSSSSTIRNDMDRVMLNKTSLSFSDSTTSYILNKEDIKVTNKLKALTTKVPDINSKMMIYDDTTKNFNFTDIPSTSSTPYVPKLIHISGKEWKQGDVSVNAGLDFMSRAFVKGVATLPTDDLPVNKKQQKRYISWFYDRKAVGGIVKGPVIPKFFAIPTGILKSGDTIEVEIQSADNDDIISNVDEYAIFITCVEFNVANIKSFDITATSDNPYLNVTAYPTEILWFENGIDNAAGLGSLPGIMLTYIYNGRTYLSGEDKQHHRLTNFRIQYRGNLIGKTNVTSL
jgi:hypothetical protein